MNISIVKENMTIPWHIYQEEEMKANNPLVMIENIMDTPYQTDKYLVVVKGNNVLIYDKHNNNMLVDRMNNIKKVYMDKDRVVIKKNKYEYSIVSMEIEDFYTD